MFWVVITSNLYGKLIIQQAFFSRCIEHFLIVNSTQLKIKQKINFGLACAQTCPKIVCYFSVTQPFYCLQRLGKNSNTQSSQRTKATQQQYTTSQRLLLFAPTPSIQLQKFMTFIIHNVRKYCWVHFIYLPYYILCSYSLV